MTVVNEPFELSLTRGPLRHSAGISIVRDLHMSLLEASIGEFLHPNEISYLEALHIDRRRTSFVMGRFAAKSALSVIVPNASHQIDIGFGVFGQPVVKLAAADQPDVSISHCDGFAAAVAFPAEHPLAIDIERCTTTTADTVRHLCSTKEVTLLSTCPWDEITSLTVQWSAKEAISKVMKFGLTVPLELLALSSIDPIGSNWAVIHFKNFTQYKCLTCPCDDTVLSLVLPRRTELICDLSAVSGLLRPVHDRHGHKPVGLFS